MNTAASATGQNGYAYVAGTFDTKAKELNYLRDCLAGMGIQVRTIDLSTSGHVSAADIKPDAVAACHPQGAAAVFTGDRGRAVAAMAAAFEHFVRGRSDVAAPCVEVG